jgi:hypothetical protein
MGIIERVLAKNKVGFITEDLPGYKLLLEFKGLS